MLMLAQQQIADDKKNGVNVPTMALTMKSYDTRAKSGNDLDNPRRKGTFDTDRIDSESQPMRPKSKNSTNEGKEDDLCTEDAYRPITSLLKDTTSVNDSEVDSDQPAVFVTAKTYSGLLSGCIAVDKSKYVQSFNRNFPHSSVGANNRSGNRRSTNGRSVSTRNNDFKSKQHLTSDTESISRLKNTTSVTRLENSLLSPNGGKNSKDVMHLSHRSNSNAVPVPKKILLEQLLDHNTNATEQQDLSSRLLHSSDNNHL